MMKRPYVMYMMGLLLFGSNGIVASHISLSSYQIVMLRTMIGSALLLALLFLTGQKFTFYKKKKDSMFLLISGISTGISWIFLYEAYAQIGVGIASLLYYCGPVIVMGLSPMLFHETLTTPKIAGFAMVVCGVLFIHGLSMDGINPWGLFCGAMSAIMYAGMIIFNKKAAAITGMENAFLQIAVSFLTVAAYTLCKSGLVMSIQIEDWKWIWILGLVNTGVGCYFYFSSIGKLPVQTVSICGYLEPLSAVLLSVVVLGETMTPVQTVGASCILGGALLGECGKSSRKKKSARCSRVQSDRTRLMHRVRYQSRE